MRKIVLSALVFASGVVVSQNPSKSPSLWTKIDELSDEFNAPLTSKWYNFVKGNNVGMDGRCYVRPENIVIGSSASLPGESVLKLITKKEKSENIPIDWSIPSVKKTIYFSGAGISSKTQYKYGYFEIYAKIPNTNSSSGVAYWFWNAGNPNNTYRELDVFEAQPKYPSAYNMAQHYSDEPGNCYKYNNDILSQTTINMGTSFHKYAVDWQPNKIDYYIDDELVTDDKSINSFSFLTQKDNLGKIIGNASISKMESMNCILWNIGSYGCEPSQAGEAFEINYFRYYEKRPTIMLHSFDNANKIWMYKASNGIPISANSVKYIWEGKEKLDVISETNDDLFSYITFKVKPAYSGQTINLSVHSERVLQNEDNTTVTVKSGVQAQQIGYDNPEFYYSKPVYDNQYLTLSVTALSDNENSEWTIGLQTSATTVDWSNPQKQWGKTVAFKNLMPGKTYVVNHGVFSYYVPWTAIQKVVTTNFDPHFMVQKISYSADKGLNVSALGISDNPNSQWSIGKRTSPTTVDWSAPQTQWGPTAIFKNLTPQTTYVIDHGVYGNYSPWMATQQEVYVDYNSDFHFKDLTDMYSSEKYFESNGKCSLKTFASSDNVYSDWYTYLVDINENTSVDKLKPIGPTQYAKNVQIDNLLPGNTYLISHGVYTSSQDFTATSRTYQLTPQMGEIPVYNVPFTLDNESNTIGNKTYKFYVPAITNVAVSTCNVSGDLTQTNFDTEIEVYDSNGTLLGTNDDECGTQSQIILTLKKGFYKVKVLGYNNAKGSYHLKVWDSNPVTTIDDNFTSISFSGTTVGALDRWTLGKTFTNQDGALPNNKTEMVYKIFLPKPANISASTLNTSGAFDTQLEIFKVNGTKLQMYDTDGYYSDDAGGASGTKSKISNIHLPEGYYYIVIEGYYQNSPGDYIIDITKETTTKSGNDIDLTSSTTQLKDVTGIDGVSIYPNPASNVLNISFKEIFDGKVELFDSYGKCVNVSEIKTKEYSVDISTLPTGIYFVVINSLNTTITQKVEVIK